MTEEIVGSINIAPPPVDLQEILRYAHAAADDNTALPQQVLEEMKNGLRYSVCYAEFPVSVSCDNELDLCFCRVKSFDLKQHLQSCTQVLLFAATVGLEPDRLLRRYSATDAAKALFVQAAGAERVEALCDAFCAERSSYYAERGLSMLPRFSPGYGDLDLSVQRDIFAVLDCPRRIGLTLNSSLLMIPSKSVTALVGLYPTPTTEPVYVKQQNQCRNNCDDCTLAQCQFRRK